MAGQLMILNPTARRRKKGKKTTRRRKRKLTPAQQKYFGKRKKKSRRRQTVIVATSNPGRGKSMAKRRRKKSHRRKFNKNPTSKRRRFRRNPVSLGFAAQSIMPAAVGAAAAIGVDFVFAKVPLPVSMQTPTMSALVKVGLSFLIGGIVSQVSGAKAGGEATAGALVVTAYGIASQYMGQAGIGAGANGFAQNYGGGYGGGYANGGGGFNTGYGMNRFVAMGKYLGRRRGMGALPNVGVRNANGARAYAPVRLNRAPRRTRGIGYIGPAKTLGRYMNNGRG